MFEFGVSDGMLSVLPLHHTFEFSTGLLVPLARGAQITYLAELNGELWAQGIQLGIEYDPQPPFDSGSTEKADPNLVELVRQNSSVLA